MPGKFVTIEHAVNEPDPVSITVPHGWVDNSAAYSDDVLTQLSVTRTAGLTGPVPGLWASRTSPKNLSMTNDGESFSIDIWAYRDRSLKEGASDKTHSDQKTLPDRTIDGLPAPGEQYTEAASDGTTYKVQMWYVLRRDGIWAIGVRGEANSLDIPQELLDAIDTIHWTPAGDGTGTK